MDSYNFFLASLLTVRVVCLTYSCNINTILTYNLKVSSTENWEEEHSVTPTSAVSVPEVQMKLEFVRQDGEVRELNICEVSRFFYCSPFSSFVCYYVKLVQTYGPTLI